MKSNPQRLYYIDWLRVLAMLSIFFFHADRFFDFYDWHVKNGAHNIISSIHVAFFVQWLMPLFFILSGAAVFYSLKFRTSAAFLWERVERILIPLAIVGYFITSPPQMYFERLTHNRFEGSFWDFIPAYFQGVDMFGGNFPWHGFHLWYLAYLFIFSVILLPLFKPGKNQGSSILSSLSIWFEAPYRLLLLTVPLIIINIFIDYNGLGFMRGTGGWDLFSYLFILLYGYLFFCNEKILYLIVTFIRCFRVLLWIVAIIGFGEKYLNFNHRFLGYAGEAVLPFYILHQFVLLLIGYWVVQWQVDALIKYIVIASLSFITIMGFYDIFIKRFQVTRFLFGMKLIRTTGF
jgi:glucan biosynthesis protein C